MAVDQSAYEAAKGKKTAKAKQVQDEISDSMKFGDMTHVGVAIADRHGKQIIDGYQARIKQIMPEIAEFLGEVNVRAKVLQPDMKKALPPSGTFISSLFADYEVQTDD
jgi:hypothetical protein